MTTGIRLLIRPGGFMDPGEAERAERVLASARSILAVAALIAIYIDPTEPTRYYLLAYSVLVAYVLYSFGVVIALPLVKKPLRLQVPLHAADLIWITVLTAFTQGPNTPFFVFFTFVLVSAAYRWGFRETLATGIILSILFVCQGALLARGFSGGSLVEGEYDLNRFILRSVYLLIMSLLLGYLAHADKRLRAETSLIARAMGKAQAEFGLSQTMADVFEEIRQFYGAGGVLLAVSEKLSGRAYLTEYEPAADTFHKLRMTGLLGPGKATYLFPLDAHAWYLSQSKAKSLRVFATDERGKRLRDIEIRLPESFMRDHAPESLLAIAVSFGEELSGRHYILNPRLHASLETEMAFILRLARQVTPPIYNVYLWRRLKAKIGGIERSRIARDLHDGVVQSLTGLALNIEGQRDQQSGQMERELLASIPSQIRNEIQNLRELIDQLRPLELRPGELVPFLVDLTGKFERDTGIQARVVSDNEEVELPPRVCREIAGIVREALTNVRKHSDACNVLVRFSCHGGTWNLVIDDDGHGFDFSGKLSHDQLDEIHKGPAVIKERVRLLKGNLTIESKPGAGSRLEVSAPVRVQAR